MVRMMMMAVAMIALMAGWPAEAGPNTPAGTSFRMLHIFTGLLDGSQANSPLVVGADGSVYGTTQTGGTYLGGTLFKLSPPPPGQVGWTHTVLHSFIGGNDGRVPKPGLASDAQGNLYGTTSISAVHKGTVFQLSPPSGNRTTWKETVLYRFQGGADGNGPNGPLLVANDGTIYGTTGDGSGLNPGMVFKLTPPSPTRVGAAPLWTKTTLHTFAGGLDGYGPHGRLVLDRRSPSGILFGVAFGGRLFVNGIIYQLTPPVSPSTDWAYTIIHRFGQDGDGYSPNDDIAVDAAGAIYGSCAGGPTDIYGLVFKLSPPAGSQTAWTEQIIYRFKSFRHGLDGMTPRGGVILDANGIVYGTTYQGGSRSDSGILYKLTPTVSGEWTETIMHRFTGNSSLYPYGGLTMGANGAIYGITDLFGSGSYNDTIYMAVTP